MKCSFWYTMVLGGKLAGILITAADDIDVPLAFVHIDESMGRAGAFRIAKRIAADLSLAERSAYAIRVRGDSRVGANPWVNTLSCHPIDSDTGEPTLLHRGLRCCAYPGDEAFNRMAIARQKMDIAPEKAGRP